MELLAHETRPDGPSRILAALYLTSAWHVGNNTERTAEADELNANALDVARQANDARSIAAALIQRGVFRYWTGDLGASKAALVEALAQIDAQNAERERPICLLWLWMSALQQGEFSEAARHHDAAVRSLEARRSQIARIFAGSQRGLFATHVGDYETAVRVLRDARAIASELGRDRDGPVSWHLGWALCASGDNATALEPLARAIEILERRKQFGQLSMAQAMAAIARARSGDMHEARGLVEAARGTALEWDWLALVWNERADAAVCEAEGHPERSPALFQKALALIPPAFQHDATEVRIALAQFLIRQRRPAEARPLLEAARDFYRDPAAFRLRAETERLLRQCEQVRT
jgi:tetratricopeptide (TPR) repeat protein